MSYSTKNYAKQGGSVWVVGGKLVPASEVQAAHIANASHCAGANPTQAEYDALVDQFNELLAAVQGVGILAAS